MWSTLWEMQPGDSGGGVGQSPWVQGSLRHERVFRLEGFTQGETTEKVGLAPNWTMVFKRMNPYNSNAEKSWKSLDSGSHGLQAPQGQAFTLQLQTWLSSH